CSFIDTPSKVGSSLDWFANLFIGSAYRGDLLCPCHFEGMIDQWFDLLDEANCMWQFHVSVEGCFILPARVNVKKLRVANRVINIMAQTSRLLSRRSVNFKQCLPQSVLLA